VRCLPIQFCAEKMPLHKSTSCDDHPTVRGAVGSVDSFSFRLASHFSLKKTHSPLLLFIQNGTDRFLESIVLMRQWQSQLLPGDQKNNSEDETRQYQWLRQSFKQVLSTLPLYLDRAQAFAGPLYGLSNQETAKQPSLEALVLEFLRRQEKLSGPSMVVAIILDAVGTSNLYPERGFRLSSDVIAAAAADARMLWPAVYMRSTMHSTGGTTGVSQRSSSVDSGLNTTIINNPSAVSLLSRHYRNSAQAAVIPPVKKQNKNFTTLLEYGPDRGVATSWPHSDWESLASVLDRRLPHESEGDHVETNNSSANVAEEDNNKEEASEDGVRSVKNNGTATTSIRPLHPVAVTYRDMEETILEDPEMSLVGETSSSFFQVHAVNPSLSTRSITMPLESALGSTKSTSTFYVVSLSNWSTMAVLVKKEGGSRWHRKRHGLSDEEIHDFLNDMASKLRVTAPFSLGEIPKSKLPQKQTGEPILTLVLSSFKDQEQQHDQKPWTSDARVRAFLLTVKEALGLRPVFLPEPTNPRSWWSLPAASNTNNDGSRNAKRHWNEPRRRLRQPRQPRVVSLSQSAAAFFLGPELGHLVR
jgi:hypothetical protein